MTPVLIVAVLLFLIPRMEPIRDDVDQIEINHYYNTGGEEVFTQLIFWEHQGPRQVVRDWRLLGSVEQLPRRDPMTSRYHLRWFDGDTYREVRSWSAVETWTDYDPEMDDRRVVSQGLRRKLSSTKGIGK